MWVALPTQEFALQSVLDGDVEQSVDKKGNLVPELSKTELQKTYNGLNRCSAACTLNFDQRIEKLTSGH